MTNEIRTAIIESLYEIAKPAIKGSFFHGWNHSDFTYDEFLRVCMPIQIDVFENEVTVQFINGARIYSVESDVTSPLYDAPQMKKTIWANTDNLEGNPELKAFKQLLQTDNARLGSLLAGMIIGSATTSGIGNFTIYPAKTNTGVSGSSLVDLAVVVNGLLPRDKQIDLAPLNDEALEIIKAASSREALVEKWSELNKDSLAFHNWVENGLRPYLVQLATSIGARSIAREMESKNFAKELQTVLQQEY